MELSLDDRNGVRVVDLRGSFDSSSAAEVHRQIIQHVSTSESIIMDMTQVDYMSSAGIRTLLLLYRTFKNSGGEVILVGLSEEIKDVLSLTGFLEFFHVRRTLEVALEAIQ